MMAQWVQFVRKEEEEKISGSVLMSSHSFRYIIFYHIIVVDHRCRRRAADCESANGYAASRSACAVKIVRTRERDWRREWEREREREILGIENTIVADATVLDLDYDKATNHLTRSYIIHKPYTSFTADSG